MGLYHHIGRVLRRGDEPSTWSRWKSRLLGPLKHHKCCACDEQFPWKELTLLECDDAYCQPCFTSFFEARMSEGLIPVMCCGTEVPESTYLAQLPDGVARIYAERLAQLGAHNPVYCHRPGCSAFISSGDGPEKNLPCRRCDALTCKDCKEKAHGGECPPDKNKEKVISLGKRNAWRRCVTCQTMIEQTEGCPTMRCTCGALFCFRCGLPWEECKCRDHTSYFLPELRDGPHGRSLRLLAMDAILAGMVQVETIGPKRIIISTISGTTHHVLPLDVLVFGHKEPPHEKITRIANPHDFTEAVRLTQHLPVTLLTTPIDLASV